MLNDFTSGLIDFVLAKTLLFGSLVDVRIARIFGRLTNNFSRLQRESGSAQKIGQILSMIENVGKNIWLVVNEL